MDPYSPREARFDAACANHYCWRVLHAIRDAARHGQNFCFVKVQKETIEQSRVDARATVSWLKSDGWRATIVPALNENAVSVKVEW